jgi:ribose transport system substrate-binding protein
MPASPDIEFLSLPLEMWSTTVTTLLIRIRVLFSRHPAASMTKPRFLLSVTSDNNDFQIEQVKTAHQAAGQAGVEIEVQCARDDGILQSQQLLDKIQASVDLRPNAILLEPAGSTTLPQVARAAAAAGIGWALLSRNADYLKELRSTYRVPAFVVAPDHHKIGCIQGRQLAALLPRGGLVLYIQGPSKSLAAQQAHWTESSAHKAVTSWLSLSTSRGDEITALCAQDDSMALGARKAFAECTHKSHEFWLKIPFLGIDGMPKTGQAWVRSGLLTATIFNPPTSGIAIRLMAEFIERGTMPPLCTVTEARSIPAIEELTRSVRKASAS